jgi:hypothetical protein
MNPTRRSWTAVLFTTLFVATLALSQPARADESLETALGLSRDQAHAVMAIEKKFRPEFAAKRGAARGFRG